VVLATNVAETSLTIEGVDVVIDSGLERRPRFDAARGMTTLETVGISQASARQRAGRAGRLGPGVCYRLWSEGAHGALLPFAPPEIRVADLAPLALELARWGIMDPAQLTWIDPPPAGHLAAAREVLRQLGAVDGRGRLTAMGKRMTAYPAHPRLARLLVAAKDAGCPALGSDLTALLSERDVFAAEEGIHGAGGSDLLDRVEALRRRETGTIQRAARYWRRKTGAKTGEPPPDLRTVGRLLAAAYPDRIGREREPGSGRYILSGGQGVRLSPRSAAGRCEWLVAVDVAGRPGGEGEVRLASALLREDVDELLGDGIEWRREVEWDERSGRLTAREVRRLGALAIQERPAVARPEDAAEAMTGVVRRKGLDVLCWRPEVRQWRARAAFLARAFPEGGWPDLSDAGLLASLEQWLSPLLDGVKSLEGLRRIDPLPALRNHLGWERQVELDRLAPERLKVPSGSNIRLDYEAEEGPVLAVKLQELFGLSETPRVAAGRVPVLIHLLSPAGRPMAVTRDLGSFWKNIYPEVKKEMKGRYPRHPWPDDPWGAEPTRKTLRGRRTEDR
jgi:ATP-dependent helicase HrpB